MLTRVNDETVSKIRCKRRPMENGLLQMINRDELGSQFRLYGQKLDRWSRDKDVTFMPIMHGACYLWQRLMHEMSHGSPHRERILVAQSYGDGQEGDAVRIHMDWILPKRDITGQHVVLMDDIYDSGLTMLEATTAIKRFNPAGIYTFFMLRKDRPRTTLIEPTWVMFDIDDCWVVGAGLDDAGRFRHLPYIAEKPRNGQGV